MNTDLCLSFMFPVEDKGVPISTSSTWAIFLKNDPSFLSLSVLTLPKGGPYLKGENAESLSVFDQAGQGQDDNTDPLAELSHALCTSLSHSEGFAPVTPCSKRATQELLLAAQPGRCPLGLCISACTWWPSQSSEVPREGGKKSFHILQCFLSPIKLMLYCNHQMACSFCSQLVRTPMI